MTHSPSIEWIVQDHMRGQIEPHLEAALAVAPRWLQSLTIRYDPSVDGLLDVGSQPEYRFAVIRVGNAWFSEDETERNKAFVHEMVHVHLQPLHGVLEDLADAVNVDSNLRRWMAEQWRRAEEGAICDLTDVLTRTR